MHILWWCLLAIKQSRIKQQAWGPRSDSVMDQGPVASSQKRRSNSLILRWPSLSHSPPSSLNENPTECSLTWDDWTLGMLETAVSCLLPSPHRQNVARWAFRTYSRRLDHHSWKQHDCSSAHFQFFQNHVEDSRTRASSTDWSAESLWDQMYESCRWVVGAGSRGESQTEPTVMPSKCPIPDFSLQLESKNLREHLCKRIVLGKRRNSNRTWTLQEHVIQEAGILMNSAGNKAVKWQTKNVWGWWWCLWK